MTTAIAAEDIVLWLTVKGRRIDLEALDWGVSPLRKHPDAANETDCLAFAAEAVLASDDVRSTFLRALTEVRSVADARLLANVAIYFGNDRAMQNFLLPNDLMKAIGAEFDEIEVSVYSTD